MAAVQAVEPDEPTEKPRVGLDALTAGETAMAERKASQSITTLGNDGYPQVGLIGALGWVLARRGDSRLTYESYMASHHVNEITAELGLGGDDDEEDEEGKAETG